jgi:hypothetical protein
MVIEMLLLCYAARLIYTEGPDEEVTVVELQVENKRTTPANGDATDTLRIGGPKCNGGSS